MLPDDPREGYVVLGMAREIIDVWWGGCNAADSAYSRGPHPHPYHADWPAKTRYISGFDPPLSCAFEGAANDFQT